MHSSPVSLNGKLVAFTGRLAALTRREAAELVASFGGTCVPHVSARLAVLVIGAEGWPLKEDGHLTRKLQRARLLIRRGKPVEIVREDEFLARLGLDDLHRETCRRYTLNQITRILEIPRDRIRSWLRAGLIQPVETVHRLAYFDYRQITALKKVSELTQAGVPLARIRDSVEQLQSWFPQAGSGFLALDWLVDERRFGLRLANGKLADARGQLLFEFADAALDNVPFEAVRSSARPLTADSLFERAAACEDAGELAAAAQLYRELLAEGGPAPEICFNLGNVLFGQHQTVEAVALYRRALELDPQYVECWNNLGSLLGDLGQFDEALRALRRAVELAPGYADALYNLAGTLEQMGLDDAARSYWQKYLRLDSRGQWADYARSRLSS